MVSTFYAKSRLMALQHPSLSDVISAIEYQGHCASRLERLIRGNSNAQLDPDILGDHTSCALGQWLMNSCTRHYGHTPIVAEAIETHAHLHFTARHILLRYYDGEKAEALSYLHEGAFVKYSHLLKQQLGELARHINKQHPGPASTMVLNEIFSHIPLEY